MLEYTIIIFYAIIYIFKIKNTKYGNYKEYRKTINIVINLVIFSITIVYTTLIIRNQSILHCGGENYSLTMFMPSILIMITYFIFIYIFNGSLIKPFSNTFGFLFFLIQNGNDKFKSLLKSNEDGNNKLNHILNIINDKPNICINEFTPYNMREKYNDFTDILINVNGNSKLYENFEDSIRNKFYFSELLFLIYFYFINIIWTKNEVLNTKCNTIKKNTTSNTMTNKKSSTTKKLITL